MPRTPDRKPGAFEEDEEIRLVTNPTGPTVAGAFNFDGTDFKMRDATGVFNPRTGSTFVVGTDKDFLLENEPPTPTSNYLTTFSGSRLDQERWERLDTTKIKTIDYTYAGNKLSVEDRKVYALDGSTVVARLTVTYTYSGSTLTSSARVRVV